MEEPFIEQMSTFLVAIPYAALIGLVTLLIGLKSISLIMPSWTIRDSFKKSGITNSGVVVAAFIIALGIVVASAVY